MLTKSSTISDRYFLILICTLLLARCAVLPFTPLTDPTEGRYAHISRQMCDSGDWITPRLWINGEQVPFLGKPPLFFWCSAAAMKVFGVNEFSARLPGLISLAAILAILWIVLKRYVDRDSAIRAVFICISSVALFVSSGLVIVDVMLTLGIAGAIFAYFAFSMETDTRIKKRWSLIVFFMLSLGFMTKGPVAIALFAMPVLAWTAYHRRWAELRKHSWISGTIMFILLTTPWFIACEIRNPGFLKYFFINENILRFITHEYGDKYGSGHNYIRGTAALMMLGATCPWSIYAIWHLLQKRKTGVLKAALRNEHLSLFIIAVLINTMFWCFARQLLIAYMFPMVPLFAAWLAIMVRERQELRPAGDILFSRLSTIICLITAIVLLVASPFLSTNRSSKAAINAIHKQALPEEYRLYFARSTPYSAYFYARHNLINHPKEPLETSLDHMLQGSQVICLIKEDHYTKLPEHYRRKIRIDAGYGNYLQVSQDKDPLPDDVSANKLR